MADQKMKQQVTMELKDDLQCPCCYKEVKKLLCKFPQIRDQRYDEKQNTVTITVVCCSPEKFRDKLCCKGGKTIQCITIKPPDNRKPQPKPKPEEKEVVVVPINIEINIPHEPVPGCPCRGCCGSFSDGCGGGPCGCGRPPYYEGCGRGMARYDYYICEENPSPCTIM